MSRPTRARRDWLLRTSLLDRFCAPLCEIMGRSEASADPADLTGIEFVRWLQEDNLFLVPLDDRYEWFRFHHLFQQLLQDWLHKHLEPDKAPAGAEAADGAFQRLGSNGTARRPAPCSQSPGSCHFGA